MSFSRGMKSFHDDPKHRSSLSNRERSNTDPGTGRIGSSTFIGGGASAVGSTGRRGPPHDSMNRMSMASTASGGSSVSAMPLPAKTEDDIDWNERPLDLERQLEKALDSAPSAYKDLVHVPVDDVLVRRAAREHRTLVSSIPEDAATAPIEKYVGECLATFDREWVTVDRPYRRYTSKEETLRKARGDSGSGNGGDARAGGDTWKRRGANFNSIHRDGSMRDSDEKTRSELHKKLPQLRYEVDQDEVAETLKGVLSSDGSVQRGKKKRPGLTGAGNSTSGGTGAASALLTMFRDVGGGSSGSLGSSGSGSGDERRRTNSGGSASSAHTVPADTVDASDLKRLVAKTAELPDLPIERQAIFKIYCDPDAEHTTVKDPRVHVQPYVQRQPLRLHVTIQDLRFKAGELEPLFASLTLYDLSARHRLSESFHFDVNSTPILNFLPHTRTVTMDPASKARRALFTVPGSSSDVFLVLRVTKTLSGDYDAAADAYTKEISDANKRKDYYDKHRGKARDTCQRRGNFRQLLCWAAVPLFDEKRQLIIGENSKFTQMLRCPRGDASDDYVMDALTDMARGTSKTSRSKTLPGECVFSAKQLESDADLTDTCELLTPQLLPVRLAQVTPDVEGETSKVVREVAAFPLAPQLMPHLEYRNMLYVYPQAVNFAAFKGSARNLAIRIEVKDGDTVPDSEGLAVLHGNSSAPRYVTRGYTNVAYHNKSPSFSDEFKLALPIWLTRSHHLLFTFYHVSCKDEKKKKNGPADPETAIGYAVLPLYPNNKMLEDNHSLPIMLNLPRSYLTSSDVSYLDGKKPLFRLRTKLCSTVYTQDPALNTFFKLHQREKTDTEASKAIQMLRSVPPEHAYQFSPTIFNILFHLMTSHGGECSMAAFNMLAKMLTKLAQDQASKLELLTPYVQYMFDNPQGVSAPVHTVIVSLWLELLRARQTAAAAPPPAPAATSGTTQAPTSALANSSGAASGGESPGPAVARSPSMLSAGSSMSTASTATTSAQPARVSESLDAITRHAGFFFDIIIKSLTLDLAERGVLNEGSRSSRVSDDVIVQIKKLVYYLTLEVQRRSKQGLVTAKELNRGVALFLKDLMSLLDRGHVFDIISRYVEMLVPPELQDNQVLIEFKFDFLRLVAQYEHYVPINLPTPDNMTASADLERTLCVKHFVAGLVINETIAALGHPEKNLRKTAYAVLRDLMTKHDFDQRYQDEKRRERVAALYFPFVILMVEHKTEWENLDADELRSLLICFVYVIKNISRKQLRDWWIKESKQRIAGFFQVLNIVCKVLEYPGKIRANERREEEQSQNKTTDAKAALESMYSALGSKTGRSLRNRSVNSSSPFYRGGVGGSAGDADTISTAGTTSSGGPPVGGSKNTAVPSRRHQVRRQQQHAAAAASTLRGRPVLLDHKAEGNLCCELTGTCTAYRYINEFHKEIDKNDMPPGMLDLVFDVLLTMLAGNQSDVLLSRLFAVLRRFINLFPRHVFSGSQPRYCQNLCIQTLRVCNFRSRQSRIDASSFLYLLLRVNFDTCGNFTRVKAQTTIALSKLVASKLKDDAYLKRSLATVCQYAEVDHDVPRQFGKQVAELTERFSTILQDSVKLNMYEGDRDMTADLYYRIAQGYKNAPDLRLTWLESLVAHHREGKQNAEAALTLLHIAALITEYLSRLEPDNQLIKQGCHSYAQASTTVALEAAAKDVTMDNEQLIHSTTCTRDSLIRVLKQCVATLKEAELYETANQVYKVLIPLYEAQREYAALADAHEDLRDIFRSIVRVDAGNTRMLGTWYRIGFYGAMFADDDGREYIYKEEKITHLYEVSERLKDFYRRRHVCDVVVFPDSGAVDRSTLDPDVAYLQITKLEPYFDAEEDTAHGLTRATYFDKHTRLRHFIYETPFTTKGTGQGGVADQHIRKTVLSVEHPMPFLKRRLEVSSKRQFELTPIQVSIDAIELRNTRFLDTIADKQAADTKVLQSLLQGSVLLQVNSGSLEYCRIFLAYPDKFPQADVKRLRAALSVFLQRCKEALDLNESLIISAQREFQAQLVLGYEKLCEKMQPFLRPEGPPAELVAQLEAEAAEKARKEAEEKKARDAQEGFGTMRVKPMAMKEESSLSDLLEMLSPEEAAAIQEAAERAEKEAEIGRESISRKTGASIRGTRGRQAGADRSVREHGRGERREGESLKDILSYLSSG